MSDERNVLVLYQNISNRLKKKRILKKPNIAEISQQFENLGKFCVRENLMQYAALCYQSAAKCQNSLGNHLEEMFLFLKSCKHFMLSYLKLVNGRFILNEYYLQYSHKHYLDCLDSFSRVKETKECNVRIADSIFGGIALNIGDSLKSINIKESCREYKRAHTYFNESPVEKIICLQKLVSSNIELGDYSESLLLINEILKTSALMSASGLQDDIICQSNITKTFLLLVLKSPQPCNSINCKAGHLPCNLWEKQLEKLNNDLFINIQSVILACESYDVSALMCLQSDLFPHLNKDQRLLFKFLVENS